MMLTLKSLSMYSKTFSVFLSVNIIIIFLSNTRAQHWTYEARVILNRKSTRPQISGSAVGGKFIFEELHFHWGDNDFDGTEHAVNNIEGSAELHLVHYNQRYGTFVQARDRSNGIVVLTVFLEVSNNDNRALQPIINVLSKIHNFNTTAIIGQTLFLDKLLPIERDFFYRYRGSLTTPPCSETVTFILFANPIGISPSQLAQFRHLLERPINGRKERIISNTRERQPRNGRVVEASVPNAGNRGIGPKHKKKKNNKKEWNFDN